MQNKWLWRGLFLIALLGVFLRVYGLLGSITNYPFPVFWSESGRMMDAYQIYAPLLSGQPLVWPWLDPARALLDGLPFLIPNSQLWMYRLWGSVLYFINTLIVSALVVRAAAKRMNLNNPWAAATLTLWGFLFLFQGPIYYHTLLAVMPIFWFYDAKKPRRMLWLIGICSLWAGLTRVNWFLMPVIVAGVLYILTEKQNEKSVWQYLSQPFQWGILGLLVSVSVYAFSNFLSGQPSILDPEMHYGFFRSKLWPNNGFSLGLLPGIGLAALPMLAVIVVGAFRFRLSAWRLAGLITVFAILTAGSTLVSLRAGGGYDLHNYDTVLLMLWLTGVFFGLGAVAAENGQTAEASPLFIRWQVVLAGLLVPLFFTVYSFNPPREYDLKASLPVITHVAELIKKEDAQKEVLIIENRHWWVYGLMPTAELFLPYEKVELMEMAMANNETYLNQFHAALAEQKFSFIVSAVLWDGYKEIDSEPFWYENNVWSDAVAGPVLKYYQPIYVNKEFNVAVYAPK